MLKRRRRLFARSVRGDSTSDPRIEEEQYLHAAQDLADADQSSADADQTSADADQSASEDDQELADRDREQSVADQRTSDRDQEAADRELAASPDDDTLLRVHERARADREAGTAVREAGGLARSTTAEERAVIAYRRDETASARDRTAHSRDQASEARDKAAAEAEQTLASRGSSFQDAVKHAAELRSQAAADRARAAADREQAAQDRDQAARDRAELLAELKLAHLDDLTGAYRRGLGEVALQQEIERVRRGTGKLVLAYVDVDGLKGVNDRRGHGAGDELLRGIVMAIRSRIRSYEPIVRFGGDEFVCSIADVDLDGAASRFGEIRRTLDESGEHGSFSVGFAELHTDDTLAELIDRADGALVAARSD
jgi:diguanylate cyclase (GGDEF)-like protein